MSQNTETSTPGNVEDVQIVINLDTPLFQVCGGQIYKLLCETVARNVKMTDGVSVETRINTLERALAANTTMRFADTIEARDKLSGLIPGDRVFVSDATADETIEKGSATYIYMPDLSFRKLSEDESMDVVLKWDDIVGKPTASPDEIQSAVLQQHRHENKTELDNLSDDGAGHLLYKGVRVNDGKAWVRMAASVEAVDKAELADGALVIVNPGLGAASPDTPEVTE